LVQRWSPVSVVGDRALPIVTRLSRLEFNRRPYVVRRLLPAARVAAINASYTTPRGTIRRRSGGIEVRSAHKIFCPLEGDHVITLNGQAARNFEELAAAQNAASR
jgi:hypothetical protein